MKLRKIYHIIFVLLVTFLTFAPTGLAAESSPETRIILLHVNDLHAKIDNFAKIAWYVQQERKQHPNVFFLDAGDNFTGNPVSDQAEPKGEPVCQLLYKMGIDAMCLGNHEFDLGQERLNTFVKRAPFPVISANIKVQSGTLTQPKPYVILKTKNGIQLAILGLIQVEKETGIPSSHPDNVKGITFPDPIATALTFKDLKKEDNIFIALTHIGADQDEILAQKMGELDLIVGGHSHTVIAHPMHVNNVLITQAGSDAKFIGRIELVVKNGKIIQKTGQLINVASISGTLPEMEAMIKKFNQNPRLDRVIAQLPQPVEGKLELGNLTTDAICRVFHLDAAFHNNGGLRIHALSPVVKLRDIYSLHPFANNIVQFDMTPDEIRSLITFDYEKHKGSDLQVSGLQYTIIASPDHKVERIDLNDSEGHALDETKTYKVGMNDYIASTYKFQHHDPGRSLKKTAADALIRYLEENRHSTADIQKVRATETIRSKDRDQ
ncbi:MAG: bifunctional metallophosphatase/5'-nucleotidase [Candidatus Omnitrophota bacterium]